LKELCAHELKYDFGMFNHRIYVDMVRSVLGLPATAAVLQRLTDAQVMEIVRASLVPEFKN
jgi:hypothetical protein